MFNKFIKKGFNVVTKGSYRTRVMMVCEDEILLIQDRFTGDGSWKLPGGGKKKGEDSKVCGKREVAEELGVELQLDDLVFITTLNPTKDAPFYKEILKVSLGSKPNLKLQKFEVRKARWFKINQLPDKVGASVLRGVKLL